MIFDQDAKDAKQRPSKQIKKTERTYRLQTGRGMQLTQILQ
jgi:hypothetical protein